MLTDQIIKVFFHEFSYVTEMQYVFSYIYKTLMNEILWTTIFKFEKPNKLFKPLIRHRFLMCRYEE